MAIKPRLFAQLEAVQAAMRKNPGMVMTWEYHTNMATAPDGRVIDIAKDFPQLTTFRTPGPWGNAIDEHWIVDAAIGAATTGTRALARVPGMCTLYAIEYIFNQAGKWRHMSGGQSGLPVTIWQDGIGRTPGLAGQHSDSGEEGLWAYLPGLIVVVPTTTYDAKGLLNAALSMDDPVLYFDYGSLAALPPQDIPDDAYIVPIGKAEVRQEGKDLTIAYWGPVAIDMLGAIPELAKAGISAEVIDVRTLKPLDEDTLIKSVTKTKRLLVPTHAHYTGSFASHLVAVAAQAVAGAKFKIMAFPDAPAPGAREMLTWMVPNAAKIVDAAKKLVA